MEHAYLGWRLSGSAQAATTHALRLIFLGDYAAGQKWVDVMSDIEPGFYSVISAQAYIYSLCGNLDGLAALVTKWQQLAGLKLAWDGYRLTLGSDLDHAVKFNQDNTFALTAYSCACGLLGDQDEFSGSPMPTQPSKQPTKPSSYKPAAPFLKSGIRVWDQSELWKSSGHLTSRFSLLPRAVLADNRHNHHRLILLQQCNPKPAYSD
jgi:hypothetical protein